MSRRNSAAGKASGPDDEPRTGAAGFGFQTIVGRSAAIQNAIELARLATQGRQAILLSGPTGTGKELFARAIHYAGPSSGEPFIVVNCGTIPEVVLESELFGHEEGAFPGARPKRGLVEIAGAGTFFLDEISELPRALQSRLLHVLEEGRVRRRGEDFQVGCRVVAASTRDLEGAVMRGEFREDLFHRLRGFRINLPPLRERGGDVELLARNCLERLAGEQGGEPRELAPDAIDAMMVHSWPGNVRELRNVVERAALVADGPVIRAAHLTIQRRTSVAATSGVDEGAGEIRLPRSGKTLEEIEREAVALTLQFTGGNQSAAARMLGISRVTLARKMGDRTHSS